jgi:predicted lipoprotein
MHNFTRLVRFEDEKGQIQYGEAGNQWEKDLHGQTLPTFNGDALMGSLELSGQTAQVAKVRFSLF